MPTGWSDPGALAIAAAAAAPVPSSSGASMGKLMVLAMAPPWASSRAAIAGSRTLQLAMDAVIRIDLQQ
jgi:hypothetical protein